MGDVKITAASLQDAIEDILREYGDVVYEATSEGINAAAKVLVKALKDGSPVKSGKYAKNWKVKAGKSKLYRYVGNAETVPGKKGDIPLSNILEYSTLHGNPHIKRIYEAAIPEMAAAAVNEIKKEIE